MESGRTRDPAIGDHAISSDPTASRRNAYLTEPAPFVFAGMWQPEGIAERDREYELTMTDHRRLASVVVTDPGAGLPPGYLEHNKAGARMMAAMGYKVGMGLGKDGQGIRMPVQIPWRSLRAGLGSIQEPRPLFSATENHDDNLPNA